MNKLKIMFLLFTTSFAIGSQVTENSVDESSQAQITENITAERILHEVHEIFRKVLIEMSRLSNHLEDYDETIQYDDCKTKKLLCKISDLPNYLQKSKEQSNLASYKYFSLQSKIQEELKRKQNACGGILYIISNFIPQLKNYLNREITPLEAEQEGVERIWNYLQKNTDMLNALNKEQFKIADYINALKDCCVHLLGHIPPNTFQRRLSHIKKLNLTGQLFPLIAEGSNKELIQFVLRSIDWKDLVISVTLFDVPDLDELN